MEFNRNRLLTAHKWFVAFVVLAVAIVWDVLWFAPPWWWR